VSNSDAGGAQPPAYDPESWKPEAGNYYICDGTWLRDLRHCGPDRGVVREVMDSGRVVVMWFPNSTEYMSARSFRQKLRSGRLVIDEEQHPYDKVDWEVSDLE